MSVFNRIFGGEQRNPTTRQEPYIHFTNKDNTERLRMVPDTSQSAVAARHSMTMIYGANSMPKDFAMRGVVEVKDPTTGQFVPVTGNSRAVPDMDAQIASLQSFRESGIIGPQPINADGSNALASTAVDRALAGDPAAPAAPTDAQEAERRTVKLALTRDPKETSLIPGSLLETMDPDLAKKKSKAGAAETEKDVQKNPEQDTMFSPQVELPGPESAVQRGATGPQPETTLDGLLISRQQKSAAGLYTF